jgi:hypothetical protein
VQAATQAALHAATGAAGVADVTPPRLRLLDIGSCHDPWRCHEDEFDVRLRCAHACMLSHLAHSTHARVRR